MDHRLAAVRCVMHARANAPMQLMFEVWVSQELEKELDNCLMTEKEMKKLMGIYWPGVHSVHGRDPPNALVDVWRAGEESRRALGEKEARRVRKEVREAEQSQAFERQAEDKRKAAEVETARREEADRKEVRRIECRMNMASPLQSTRRNSNGNGVSQRWIAAHNRCGERRRRRLCRRASRRRRSSGRSSASVRRTTPSNARRRRSARRRRRPTRWRRKRRRRSKYSRCATCD